MLPSSDWRGTPAPRTAPLLHPETHSTMPEARADPLDPALRADAVSSGFRENPLQRNRLPRKGFHFPPFATAGHKDATTFRYTARPM